MLNQLVSRLSAAVLVLVLAACATPAPAPVEIRKGVIEQITPTQITSKPAPPVSARCSAAWPA